MNDQTVKLTKYFRNAVAAQSNMGIDFKSDYSSILDRDEVLQGWIHTEECEIIFKEAAKYSFDAGNKTKKKDFVNVIICAKTIKTVFEATEKVRDEFDELTGIFYVPAILSRGGMLKFDEGEKKLPWFPREYLTPMIEAKLAIGSASDVDLFISSHVDRVEKIKSWMDYVSFFKEMFEAVTCSPFEVNFVRNIDQKEPIFELESKMYLFLDKTVKSTFNIIKLYNDLQRDDQPKKLYDNFMSIHMADVKTLVENNLSSMTAHCGQMNGEYPLSPSQREAVNHFAVMDNGEILAVNGPPGTGKTTLLQTIVADLYVERALKREKAPLIVATSTNNQAVTNIITSFGNIKRTGISNLEERWIEGVSSFATYFPSQLKVNEAKRKRYQYTTQKGDFFVSEVEEVKNVEASKEKLINSCNAYFSKTYANLTACQDKLHKELLFMERSKTALLSLAKEASQFDLQGETIDLFLKKILLCIEEEQTAIVYIQKRIIEWENCYKKIPFYVRWLQFIEKFSKKIQTEFRLFMNDEELDFLNECMSLDVLKEKYSEFYAQHSRTVSELKLKKSVVEKIIESYDRELEQLRQHGIILHGEKEEIYRLDLDYVNNLLDKKHRYVEFWLAVHYYECRWASGEDQLSEKQKGTNYKNVLSKFYHRLSMITPCLVMTFYMLPKQFLAFGDQKRFFLYNYVDLLIVDEAGQVSPEIAAGAFALAKRAVVVGDIHQIEPVRTVNRALDKTLALASGTINTQDEFLLLEESGLNSSDSNVMKVAAKCCKYEKYNDKGLFLCEHRRCYDEIINYCNKLVYKGNLQPMRGSSKNDKKRAISQWPPMGYVQIDTEYSNRKGSSRANRAEAEQIANWLKDNFSTIVNAYKEEPEESLVGIITPFKAQTEVIVSELKRKMPDDYKKISVGTVHTFQGAERKIIIMSTVYGKQDGCFFIDANKSLMNVAVSRAKDHFFVFGDLHCLKDAASSASGLLKAFVAGFPLP